MLKCGCDPHVEWCPECRAEKRDQENRERGWIKCSDQMPSDSTDVLVTKVNKNGADPVVKCAYWLDPYEGNAEREEWEHGAWWRGDWSYAPEEITHWMKLPEPPKP